MGDISAYDYIKRQIQKNNCTLVLGAGVSNAALSDSDRQHAKGASPKIHLVREMCKAIAKCLCKNEECEFQCFSDKEIAKEPGPSQQSKQEPKCEIGVEFKSSNLSRLSERFHWKVCAEKRNGAKMSAHKELIKILEIGSFADLKPTKAHYFISYLAREGYISEIITTNYDCCMEKAYLDSWGLDFCGYKENKDVNPVARIFDCNTFAKNASRKLWGSEHSLGKPYVLKIYKINGCALETYKPETILLTDTQLQNWKQRQWAADLFRDRLRTTSLFFNGFGSDEPQILHTLQVVFEEFDVVNDESGGKDYCEKDRIEPTNAPIVAHHDEKPSYPQEYVEKEYRRYYNENINLKSHMISRKDFKNDDYIFLQEKNKLKSDMLWEKLYMDFLNIIIYKALIHSSNNGQISLAGCIPNFSKILSQIAYEWKNDGGVKELKKILYSPGEDMHEKSSSAIYDTLPKIILILSKLIHPNGAYPVYCAINDYQSVITEIIFLLWILREDNIKIDIMDKGVLISHTNCTTDMENKFMLWGDKGDISPITIADSDIPINLCILRIGASFNPNDQKDKERLWKIRGEHGPNRGKARLTSKRIYMLSWFDIFENFESALIYNEKEIKNRITDAIRYPTKYTLKKRGISNMLSKFERGSENA